MQAAPLLRELRLEGCRLARVPALAGCSALRLLSVRGNRLRDIAVGGALGLREIDGRDNAVKTAAGVRPLSAHPQLRKLWLWEGNPIGEL